jgi:hypothetical protein
MKMQRDGADSVAQMREMQEQMKNMPPEQRQMVENMMKQHGVSIQGGGNFKVCMSKESLDTDAWHRQQERDMGCKSQTTRVAKVWKWHQSCPAPHASETMAKHLRERHAVHDEEHDDARRGGRRRPTP